MHRCMKKLRSNITATNDERIKCHRDGASRFRCWRVHSALMYNIPRMCIIDARSYHVYDADDMSAFAAAEFCWYNLALFGHSEFFNRH